MTGRDIGGLLGAARFELVVALAAVITVLALMPVNILSDSNSDSIILDVNVSTSAVIRVLPVNITWNASMQVNPGENGSIMNVSVKNIGSINVTDIYATVDTTTKEDVNPLPIGNSSYYAASGLIMIRNETDTNYWHLGRLEWNLSEYMDSEIVDLEPGTERFGHGWYRTQWGNDHLWKIENGSYGWCNDSDTILKIKKDPENETSYARDLSDATGNLATASVDDNNTDWTFFTFDSGPLFQYCVASWHDCTKIYIYKFDKSASLKSASGTGCADAIYMTQENLTPGDSMDAIKLMPSIPEGFPGGDTNTSIMTIWASSA